MDIPLLVSYFLILRFKMECVLGSKHAKQLLEILDVLYYVPNSSNL